MEQAATLNAIQLAVAPVFLLTAVATLIGVIATRLGRIIDRARVLEERLEENRVRDQAAALDELAGARLRGSIVNFSLGLLTVSAALIGATVVSLFLGGTTAFHTELVIPWSFLGGLVCFILALLCFLTETLLATRVLNFGRRSR